MSSVACTCCGKFSEPHKSVKCAVCKKPFKIDCVDISNSEARKINSGSGLSWSCSSCALIGNDLNSLKAVIVSLQDEIKTLKEAINTPSVAPSLSLLDTEKIIQEVSERERRKTNLMVYGRSESSCKSNADQIALDLSFLKDMFNGVEFKETNFKVQRLGRFDISVPNRCRPIKVQFSEESAVSTLLKVTNRIRSFDKWKNLSFSRDQTPMQRDIYRNARAQLQDRLNGGERNLRIKYKNGIPNIVSTSEN